jgi:uncharacterized membrane protein HdeD (DUF308 family)
MTSTASTPSLATTEAQVPWWLVLIVGIASVILGIMLLVSPGVTLVTLVLFLGAYWLVRGIFTLGSLFVDRTLWGWRLFVGILGIVAGLAVLNTPLWSAILIPAIGFIVLGVQAIISGVVELFQAFRGGGWGLGIVGLINLLLGILIVANPLIGVAVLPWTLGFFAIVGGIAAIFLAFRGH